MEQGLRAASYLQVGRVGRLAGPGHGAGAGAEVRPRKWRARVSAAQA
jgi:hypothetical protein